MKSTEATIDYIYESSVSDFFSLLKPRVMSLVIFTGMIGLLLAPGNIGIFFGTITILSIAIGSGASGAINMWYDRDIDTVMERTARRAIPSGRVHHSEALFFGIVLSLLSIILLSFATNYLAGFLLFLAIFIYVFIYTIWLKRTTPQNIVIGGASGALPPVIGWVAVSNEVTFEPLLLFAIIFFWTPYHFWALSLVKSREYGEAGVPMLPLTHGERFTRINILLYSLIVSLLSLLPIFLGYGILYLATAMILSAYSLYLCIRLQYDNGLNMRVFLFSILHLFILFLAFPLDKLMRGEL